MPTTSDLFKAIDCNNLSEVQRLIEDKEGLTYTHAYDYSSPLMHVAECGYLEMVRYLLDHDYCDVDEGNDQTWYSPLIAAVEKGHTEICRILIKYGADVDRQYEKEIESDESYQTFQEQGYSLTLAIEYENMEIARLLLENGADTESAKWFYDGQWNSNKTPLLLAIESDRFDLAEMLLEHGADVDGECTIRGELHTPLSYALALKLQGCITFLLKNGADTRKEIEDGQTVFEYAEELGRIELLN